MIVYLLDNKVFLIVINAYIKITSWIIKHTKYILLTSSTLLKTNVAIYAIILYTNTNVFDSSIWFF